MTGLFWTVCANHWTAKVSIFYGKVVKNSGSHKLAITHPLASFASGIEPALAARSYRSTRRGLG